MKRIAWPQLMRLGLTHLGMTPDIFWNLTPAELMLMAGLGQSRESLTRAGLTALESRFPDKPRRSREEQE